MNKTYTESFQVRATDCDFERRMRLDAPLSPCRKAANTTRFPSAQDTTR